jgi:hypothetical protein
LRPWSGSSYTQIDALERKANDQIRDAMRIAWGRDVRRLEAELAVAGGQVAAYEKTVERRLDEANTAAKTSANIQRQKADLVNLDKVLQSVAEEREQLKVEIDSAPRVAIKGDRNAPAARPESASNGLRCLITLIGSILAMIVGTLSVVVWNLCKKRVEPKIEVLTAESPHDEPGT